MPEAVPDTEPVARGPLTVQQEVFVRGHSTVADPARLNVTTRIDLDGALDVVALGDAIARVGNRHESLRTRYAHHADGFVQEVLPVRVRLTQHRPPEHDASGALPAGAVDGWCAGLAATPFRLDVAPLVRFELMRLDARRWTLVIVQHHANTDAVATATLLAELAECYTAAVAGRTPRLTPEPTQPIDHARWQRRYLDGPDAARSLDYWRGELADACFTLPLPTDRPRPDVLSGRGFLVQATLSGRLWAGVGTLARELGVTPYSVLLATHGKLLWDLTGQADVVVVGTYAGRLDPRLSTMVGLASNSVALRLRPDRDGTVRGTIRRITQMIFEHADHQEFPFPVLRDELDLGGRPDARHFPRCMFAMGSKLVLVRRFGDHRVRIRPVLVPGARTDLLLVLTPGRNGLGIRAEASADTLAPATVRTWLRRYVALLRAAVTDVDAPLNSWS